MIERGDISNIDFLLNWRALWQRRRVRYFMKSLKRVKSNHDDCDARDCACERHQQLQYICAVFAWGRNCLSNKLEYQPMVSTWCIHCSYLTAYATQLKWAQSQVRLRRRCFWAQEGIIIHWKNVVSGCRCHRRAARHHHCRPADYQPNKNRLLWWVHDGWTCNPMLGNSKICSKDWQVIN